MPDARLDSSLEAELAGLELELGGRLGLAVLDIADGRRIEHRADERFAMCSTFKLTLAAMVLSRVDGGALGLDQVIHFDGSRVLPHSPVTEVHASTARLPLETILKAAIELSDNTAANALLALMGGPPAYTAYLRGLGDTVTRLDRIELELNSNEPRDARDTTTPRAMLADMRRTLLGDALGARSRSRLIQWMRDCTTGEDRLRARLPAGWQAGDKTGTGDHGAVNDLAIFWPPGSGPILVACYLTGSSASVERLSAAHAQIGALLAARLRPGSS